jgi:hypothetical protein
MVRSADMLMYLDDVQYTRRDWRNRNLIMGTDAPQWLTIPVQVAGQYHAKIYEIECANTTWWRSHLSSLDSVYKKYSAYNQFRQQLGSELEKAGELKFLSQVNRHINNWLFSILGIHVSCLSSQDFPSSSDKSERLADLCAASGADTYISGPAAQSYLDESLFHRLNLQVAWINYELLPELPEVVRASRELSIIHLLATLGTDETIRLSTFGSALPQSVAR